MPDHVDRIVQAWRRERPDLDLAALVLLGRLFRTAHLGDAALAKPWRPTGSSRAGSTCWLPSAAPESPIRG